MARGGYFVGEKGMDQFVAALQQTADGMDDLSAMHKRIGHLAETWVKRRVPTGAASPKDSSKHKPPGYLRSIVVGGHGKWGSWVQMNDESGVLTLQEWGGKSIWRRGGATWSPTKARGRATGYFTVSHKAPARPHLIYEKPRRKNGYFIWNVGYYLRDEINGVVQKSLTEIADKHGIAIEIAADAIDVKAEGRPVL